jgi:glycerophosphoryl diester phosphodiesterase
MYINTSGIISTGIDPSEVWPQSFYVDDVIYWVKNTDFGDQAVALHEVNETETEYRALHKMLQENGVKVVAPPLFMMVEYDETSELGIIASPYGASAKENGLSIIAWSLERDSPALDGWYWSTLQDLNRTVGDNLALLHVLSEEVGVMAVFSDWPATTTFYANCMGLGLDESAPPETAESSESGSTGGIEEVGDFEDVTGIMEKDTEAASSGKGEQRHLKAASQLLNIALKLVGI